MRFGSMMRWIVPGLSLGVAIAALSGVGQRFVPHTISAAVAQTPPTPNPVVDRDAPYLPTPQEVVAEMLKVAQVKQQDQLYDLGSGDGRIVITAAKNYGTPGVGIEIDPTLIQKSQANAQSAGVSDRVKFMQQDLFATNLSNATVVTLYLLPALNLKLRPKLLQELRPGTRIVSHAFNMGDWKPDKTLTVRVPNNSRLYAVYYWVVPAQVEGKWQGTLTTPLGQQPVTLNLQQKFQQVTGSAQAATETLAIKNAKLNGRQISFKGTKQVQGQPLTIQFDGTVNGRLLKGTAKIRGGFLAGNYQLVAQRR
jgi:precorrin-6B methylase 2